MTSWLLGVLAGVGGGVLLGWLAVRLAGGRYQTPALSRKLFHVGIFTLAAVVHLLWGEGGILGFGVGVSAVLFPAVQWGWRGGRLSKALAGEGSGSVRRPVLMPWAATAVGGLVNLVLVGSWAVVGYAVCGWGDAAGELVGGKWGKRAWKGGIHWLPVSPRKTVEGSAAVWVVGTMGAWWALVMLGESWSSALLPAVFAAGVGALAEGVIRGPGDNFLMQVAPSVAAWWVCS